MKRRDRSYERLYSNNQKEIINSNVVTSKRITMPPKFLTLNVISETARKNDYSARSGSKKTDNDYDIFEHEPVPNLRRSARINNRKSSKNIGNLDNKVTDDSFVPNYSLENNFYENPQEKHKQEPKRKCKSLFKEINRRYAEIGNEENKEKDINFANVSANDLFIEKFSQNTSSKSTNLHSGDLNLWDMKTEKKKSPPRFLNEMNNIFQRSLLFEKPFYLKAFRKYEVNLDFCIRLTEQLLDSAEDFKEEVLDECKNKLKKKIHDINYILQGKGPKLSQLKIKSSKSQYLENDNLDLSDITFEPLPETDWTLQTPTKQKVIESNLPKRTIRPAFAYTNNDNHITSILELNPDVVTIDVSKFQDASSQNSSRFVRPVEFFNSVPINFNPVPINLNPSQNLLDITQPGGRLGPSLDRCSTQESYAISKRSLFEFKPHVPTGNFFL